MNNTLFNNYYPVANNPVDNAFAEAVNTIPLTCFTLWMLSTVFARPHMRFWRYMSIGTAFAIVSSIMLKGTATYGCDSYRLTLCARPNGFDNYGMPSGHTQLAVFSTLFPFLIFPDGYTLLLAVSFSTYMGYTRVAVFHMHTVLQVLAGAVVGIVQSAITAHLYLTPASQEHAYERLKEHLQ